MKRRIPNSVASTLIDQVIASGSNALYGVVAARTMSRLEFGSFAIAATYYYIVLGLTRSMFGESLMVRLGTLAERASADLRRSCAVALLFSGALTAVFAITAPLVPGGYRNIWLAIAVATTGFVLAEFTRWAYFILGTPRKALTFDLVWATAMLVVFPVLAVTGIRASGPLLVMWWGASGVLVAVFVLRRGGLRPDLKRVRSSVATLWKGGREFAGLFVVTGLSSQAVFLVLGFVAGREELGGLRAGLLLFAPLGTIFGGLSVMALRRFALLSRTSGDPRGLIQLASLGAVVLVVLWFGFMYALVRGYDDLLGPSTAQAARLLPIVAFLQIAQAVILGPTWFLQGSGLVKQLRVARVWSGIVSVVLGCTGAFMRSSTLSLLGVAVGIWLGALLSILAARNQLSHGSGQPCPCIGS